MDDQTSGIEDRLRAADPAATSSYQHPDFDAMIARVTATPRVKKVRLADGLRLKIGSAAAAATLVTAGAIGAISSAAPSLSVLALGKSTTPSSASAPISGDMRVLGNYQFVAGSGLSDQSASAPTYTLSAPADLEATTASVATALGVNGTVPTIDASTTNWQVTGDNGTAVSFWLGQGSLSWNYFQDNGSATSPGSAADGSGGVTTTPATVPAPTNSAASTSASGVDAQSLASAVLGSLGVSASDLGPAQESTYDDPTNGLQTTETYAYTPNGVDTGLSFTFTYDSSGTLVSANGAATVVSDGPAYPLLSQTDAVAALQKQYDSFSGGPIVYSPPVTSPSGTSSSGSSGTTDPTPTTNPSPSDPTTTTLPPTVITLVSATIQYGQYELSDGSEALLPQYLFTSSDGNTWSVLAVDPSYVSLAPVAVPMGAL